MIDTHGWVDAWPEHPNIHWLTPPRKVLVDMDIALGLARHTPRADRIPLHVKATAIHIDGIMAGTQFAWLRTTTSIWIAVVKVAATSGNHQNTITLDLCVTEDAISLPVDHR